MIKFYYHPSPNPAKVALFLEEAGLPYEVVPVDTRKGEQHDPAYRSINPNAKVPALIDGDAVVFDSNAILLYLGEKTGKFLPANTPENRARLYSWMMFVASGIGPYSGQSVHFRHFAAEQIPYAINRYDYEAWRHWDIINAQLGKEAYMLGAEYTLVDMAVWGWATRIPFILGDDAWSRLPNIKRHLDEINARPAAQRVDALKDRHAFKSVVDEEARRVLFPHALQKTA